MEKCLAATVVNRSRLFRVLPPDQASCAFPQRHAEMEAFRVPNNLDRDYGKRKLKILRGSCLEIEVNRTHRVDQRSLHPTPYSGMFYVSALANQYFDKRGRSHAAISFSFNKNQYFADFNEKTIEISFGVFRRGGKL